MTDPPQTHGGSPDPLGRRLARLRRRSGLSGKELAVLSGMSQSKVSRLETGVTAPSASDVKAIAGALELPRNEADALLAMLETSIQDWRGEGTGTRIDALQEDVAHYEQGATTIRLLQTSVIPGLLQTAEYARSILGAYEQVDDANPRMVSDAVVKRIQRQQVLHDSSKQFKIVFLESVLYYLLSSPSVMMAQVERLLKVSRFNNVSLRIIPLLSELPAVAPHPVEIFDDTTLTIDLATTALFSEGQSDIRFYTALFEKYFDAGTEDVDDILAAAYRRFADLAARGVPGLLRSGGAVSDSRPTETRASGASDHDGPPADLT